MKGRAAFLTLGCKVNAYETNAMETAFREAGYEIVPFSETAEVYIINTCSVTNMADRKSRQMIHRARKKNPTAVIIAAGCYVETAKASGELDDVADVFVGNQEKGSVVAIYEEYLEDREKKHTFQLLRDQKEVAYEPLHIEDSGEKTRVFLKIQDGCSQFCSYCIIPYARGRIRSRRPGEVISETMRMAEKGFQEVVINGIHLSSYGMDFSDGVRIEGNEALLGLLEELDRIEGLCRIRLGSLEPRFITEESAERLSKLTKLCPHFHLSLQSGCDRTLKRMNRHYTTAQYAKGVELLRKYFDSPAITTDVIVGFPGEDMEEFEETKEFLKEIQFSSMHIFKYSVRKGTRAQTMPNQVPEPEKTKRSEQLFEIEQKSRSGYESALLGKTVEILVEEKTLVDGKTYYAGHTTTYVKILIPVEGKSLGLENTFVAVCPEKFMKDGGLIGRLVK